MGTDRTVAKPKWTRPTSLVAEALRATRGNVAAAAERLGMTRTSLWHRIARSRYLQQVREEAREAVLDAAEAKLEELALRGEVAPLIFLLKTRGRSRGYVERVEHVGDGGGPVRVEHSLAPEEAAVLYEAAAERYRRLAACAEVIDGEGRELGPADAGGA